MTYAIGYVIYGLPLTEEVSRKITAWRKGKFDAKDLSLQPKTPKVTSGALYWEDDDGVCGFELVYNGGSSDTDLDGWVGTCVGEFDECGNFPLSKLEKFKDNLSDPDKIKIQHKIMSTIHPTLIELAGGKDAFDFYVVWGTS